MSYNLSFTNQGSQGRKQGKNLEAKTEAEVIQKYCLKACSLRLSRFDFLYHPRPPAQGWHNGLGSPHLLSIKKIPTDMPTDQSYGGIFSNRIPSSQTCLGLCQVKKPTSTSGNLGSESRPTNRRDQILLGGDSTHL